MSRLARPLAIALLVGTLVVAIGGIVHPMLEGTAADHLRLIAGTPHWRALHLAMLAGSALVVAGLWVRLLDRVPGEPPPGALAAAGAVLATIAIGLTINALNIAYMAGAGTHLAARFAAGDAAMATLYEATHPIGLMAARFGNALVALGALALGAVEWHDDTRPRWLAWLAWIAGIGGVIGVAFFHESARPALAAVALLTGWQLATAVRGVWWGSGIRGRGSAG